jgi:hypothetical protein
VFKGTLGCREKVSNALPMFGCQGRPRKKMQSMRGSIENNKQGQGYLCPWMRR